MVHKVCHYFISVEKGAGLFIACRRGRLSNFELHNLVSMKQGLIYMGRRL
jgi:hypothetical protein